MIEFTQFLQKQYRGASTVILGEESKICKEGAHSSLCSWRYKPAKLTGIALPPPFIGFFAWGIVSPGWARCVFFFGTAYNIWLHSCVVDRCSFLPVRLDLSGWFGTPHLSGVTSFFLSVSPTWATKAAAAEESDVAWETRGQSFENPVTWGETNWSITRRGKPNSWKLWQDRVCVSC